MHLTDNFWLVGWCDVIRPAATLLRVYYLGWLSALVASTITRIARDCSPNWQLEVIPVVR